MRKMEGTMKLNVEALLAKNPQVDRKVLHDNAKKAVEATKSMGKGSTEKPVTPPYGGRRMVSDQEGKERTRYGVSRE
jgi:hypothetical protein